MGNPRIKRAGRQLAGILQRMLGRQRQIVPGPDHRKRDQKRESVGSSEQWRSFYRGELWFCGRGWLRGWSAFGRGRRCRSRAFAGWRLRFVVAHRKLLVSIGAGASQSPSRPERERILSVETESFVHLKKSRRRQYEARYRA